MRKPWIQQYKHKVGEDASRLVCRKSITVSVIGDTKEGYYICRHVEPESEEAKKPLHGPNVFPDERHYPEFKRVTCQYFDAMSKLGYAVVQVFGQALGEPDFFSQSGVLDK